MNKKFVDNKTQYHKDTNCFQNLSIGLMQFHSTCQQIFHGTSQIYGKIVKENKEPNKSQNTLEKEEKMR